MNYSQRSTLNPVSGKCSRFLLPKSSCPAFQESRIIRQQRAGTVCSDCSKLRLFVMPCMILMMRMRPRPFFLLTKVSLQGSTDQRSRAGIQCMLVRLWELVASVSSMVLNFCLVVGLRPEAILQGFTIDETFWRRS